MITWLDAIPLWTMILLTVVLILVCFEIGYRFGRRNQIEREGALVGAGVGLLAFFLAFHLRDPPGKEAPR